MDGLTWRPSDRAVRFFNWLRHTKGQWAGQPFALGGWQAERVVRPFLDTLLPDGRRQYRNVYLELPRKNGKSTLAAGLALYFLLADDEPGAEVYSAAADRNQAAIIFDTAAAMIRASPHLSSWCKVYRREIVVPTTESFYRVLSADVPSKHGLNPHAVIVDELHALPGRELWDVLTTAQGSRRQPAVVAITTAGDEPQSIAWQVKDYARKVAAGVIPDPTWLSVIYAIEPGERWDDRATWARVNPGLGTTLSEEYIEAAYRRAQQSLADQLLFRRLHLNDWLEEGASQWLPLDAWDRCGADVPDAELLGRDCYAGLDLSSTTDLSALVLVFPLPDGSYAVRCRFWVPGEQLQRRGLRDRAPYEIWVRQGLLHASPGDMIDHGLIHQELIALARAYHIREVAIDRWNAAMLTAALQQDGLTVVPMGQGYASMTAPMRFLEGCVVGGKLRHGGHPVLRWMATNLRVAQDPAGNVKPDKARSHSRIDGIVALAMALARAGAHRQMGVGGWLL
jgi:phage terminase large subunit-like protein